MKKSGKAARKPEMDSVDACREWPLFLDGLAGRAARIVEEYERARKRKATVSHRERKEDKLTVAYVYARYTMLAAKKDRDRIVDKYLDDLDLKPRDSRALNAVVAKHLNLAGDQSNRKYRNEIVLAIKTLIANRVRPDQVIGHNGGIRAWAREWHTPDSGDRHVRKGSKSSGNLAAQIADRIPAKPGQVIQVRLKVGSLGNYQLLGRARFWAGEHLLSNRRKKPAREPK